LGVVTKYRALRALAAGDEVTIAYVEMAAPRLERRVALRRQYFFDLDGGDGDEGGSSGGHNKDSGGCGSGALWCARDVALWGAPPAWSEALPPTDSPAAGSNSSGGPATEPPDGVWAVHGFGPSPAPPWRQDARDADMCRVSALVPATTTGSGVGGGRQPSANKVTEVPLPGGMLVIEGADAGDADAAAVAEALGPVAAESFAVEAEEEQEEQEGIGSALKDTSAAVAAAAPAAAAAKKGTLPPPRTRVLQWGDWASAFGNSSSSSSSASTRALAVAAARQLRRAYHLQERAHKLVAAGRAGEAADTLVAALACVGSTPPAVACAAGAADAAASLAAISLSSGAPADTPPTTTIALGPLHALTQRLLGALLSAAIAAGDRWPLALAAAEALGACYNRAYPRVWPNRGLHNALLAKLLLLLERPKAALKAADGALESLRVTHCGAAGSEEVLGEVLRLRGQAAHEVEFGDGRGGGGDDGG
jgi:hypothetical protein